MANQTEKEILNQLDKENNENYPVVEAEPNPEIEKDVEQYIEKVEKEQFLSQPINDDYGQPLISPPAPQQPKIVLPISESQYLLGMKQKVTESVRWLVVWCGKIIKQLGKRAVFQEPV